MNHQDQDKIFLKIGLKTIGKKKIVAARKQYGEEEGGGVGHSVGVHAASSGRPSCRDVAGMAVFAGSGPSSP